nr:unnamed protein product [Digitaria exilis]
MPRLPRLGRPAPTKPAPLPTPPSSSAPSSSSAARSHATVFRLRAGSSSSHEAMELFLDRAHLRLRSREEDTYLHADEDGWGVSGSPHRASLNTAWVVHLLRHVGATYVLLHGAAYGRYLALRYQPEPQLAPPQMQPQGHHLDYRTIQRVYDTPVQADVMWEVRPAGDGSGDVRLRHAMYHAFVMPLWIVEAIPARQLPPDLPQQVPR